MQIFRLATLGTILALAACAVPPAAPGPAESGLQRAARNYPPLIPAANVGPADGQPPYAKACPRPGSRVVRKFGPTFTYLGASPSDPELCRIQVGKDVVEAWFAIWLTSWPGQEQAHPALRRILHGRTGDVEAFDTVMGPPGYSYHEFLRNEGIEELRLGAHVYRAAKLSHYREGFDGNTYRSVITVWKDIDSGLVLYATYQHIAGAPVVEAPILPETIVP